MQRISFKKVLVLVFAMTLPIIARSALAVSPLVIPDQYMVCSNNHKYCAVFDKKAGVKAYKVFNVISYPGISYPLWHLSKEVKPGYLSNDGRYLVEDHLLFVSDYDQIIFSVYRDGAFEYFIKLKDLIKDFRKLERTISHFRWGISNKGFDNKGRFIVETVEKRRLAIDIKTGEITEQ